MQLHKILTLIFIWCFSQALSAQCPPGQNEVRIEINTDDFFYEVHWTLSNLTTGMVYVRDSVPNSNFHTRTYCIPAGDCTQFRITDDYGDGMEPDGEYRLYLNDSLIRENIGGAYFKGESVYFGCPPGTTCESALPIDTGSWATPNGSQIWYRFVPADTGVYKINTCNPLNACGSKIWVYGRCEGIIVSDDLTGSDFYSDGGCDNGALASLILAGGQDYYIRLRYEPNHCDTLPIHFTLTYDGPVVGCTDPTACNYNALATISSDCIYPGDPACPEAPDLVAREDIFRQSLEFGSMNNSDACQVDEGCIRGLGTRYLIHFSTEIANIGEQDYYIGPSPTDINTPSNQFVWDPCHHHWHYLGYADYILFNAAGLRIPIGSKTGFCVLDLICPPQDSKYDCVNMGITAGCADVYEKGLPCQWIDITDIPSGDYTMVMRVNWDKSPDASGRQERNYENNWAQACFTLTYDGVIPTVEFHNDQCAPFVDCAGETYGNAQPDCNGVCNGPSLHGDWNQDTLRNATDTQAYLAAANADNGDASTCLDLDGNGAINVYDAALDQECAIHQNEPGYWIQQFPCQFPAGFSNTQDLVVIQPGSIDTVAKTFDIKIVNPFNRIMGFEFSVSGLVINSIDNLSSGYNADLRFNAASGEVVGLALDESSLAKNALPNNFLRIHYTSLTGTEVCVSKITAVVNSKYQLSNASLGNPNCVVVKTSGVGTPNGAPFGVYVQPNPFVEITHIFFENETAEPMRIQIMDITGKVVRSFEGIRGNSVSVERNNLAAGTYIFTVSGSKGTASGKVMAQ